MVRFKQFSLTPALSRWERENNRPMNRDANDRIRSWSQCGFNLQNATAGREGLEIKKRIQPGPCARVIRDSRFVFIFPLQPHRAALKEQAF
jgi:hypothetical protein